MIHEKANTMLSSQALPEAASGRPECRCLGEEQRCEVGLEPHRMHGYMALKERLESPRGCKPAFDWHSESPAKTVQGQPHSPLPI